MLELYKLITSRLKELPYKVYNETIPQNRTFPFVVFKFNSVIDVESTREDVTITIDVWDKGKDVVRLQNICSEIDKKLNRLQFNNKAISTNIYRMNPYLLNIPDPEEEIKHRQLRYITKNYEMEVI